MKKRTISLLFLLIYVLSLFAFASVRNFRVSSSKGETNLVGKIVYNISEDAIVELVKRGITVVKLTYNPLENYGIKDYLENLMKDTKYKDQMTLVEISDTSAKLPQIEIVSPNTNEIIETNSSTLVRKKICEALVNPPIDCIV